MPTLYIVATPIGNLEDITLRALRVLKEVDFILCEDTRVTRKLLAHYEIYKPLIAYHQHSDERKVTEIVALLNQGKNLALVTDAGTPGISDPGGKLIESLVRAKSPFHPPFTKGEAEGLIDFPPPLEKGERGGFNKSDFSHAIIPIPGASALTAALSISGFPTDHFVFMGFPPHKKHRKQFFEKVAQCPETVVFYESPYRIVRTLGELKIAMEINSAHPPRRLVVCRELTKIFETVYRGTIKDVTEQIKKDKIKGEFVVVIGPQN